MEDAFCQNSERALILAVETDRHKKVSIHSSSTILTPLQTLTHGHIHLVRAKVGHSNPNPTSNANLNPKDGRVTVLIAYIPANSLHSM